MEAHGKNPIQNVIAIIPARFDSSRLEGKLLLAINGKPLILHTLEQAKQAANVSRVIVATDDERILTAVKESGNEAVITSSDHKSGSDRIAEVAQDLPQGTLIVNVQGDEPMISPRVIERAVEAMKADDSIDICTTCEKIENYGDVLSPDVVKVVTDTIGNALYFSRSPIPFPREEVLEYGGLEKAFELNVDLVSRYRKHTGLYVYRREFLLRYTNDKQTLLEEMEVLEQLRALENGAKIRVLEVEESSIGVDTLEDFNRVKEILESNEAR